MKKIKYVDIYDVYSSKDFKYGDLNSTNLNPKREVLVKTKEVFEDISDKLQAMTDVLVKKYTSPVETTSMSTGIESLNKGISPAKQQAILNVGSVGDFLFPIVNGGFPELEFILGTFPDSGIVDELDEPITLDCDAILNGFYGNMHLGDSTPNTSNNGYDSDTDSGSENTDESTDSESDSSDSDANEDEEDIALNDVPDNYLTDYFDDLDNTKNCAIIELGWLKILLVILQIIAILKKIIDFVLAIIMMIVEIIRLVVGVWLNPVNIEKIKMMIMQLVISILMMVITTVIQMIWDLLNIDCVGEFTQSLVDQISRVMSAFSSITGMFNPNAVGMIMKDFNDKVMDPLADTFASLKKDNGFLQQFQNMKEMFNADVLKKDLSNIGNSLVGGIANDSNLGKAASTINSVKDTFSKEGQLGGILNAFNSFKDVSLATSQSKRTKKAAKDISSPQFVGFSFTTRDQSI